MKSIRKVKRRRMTRNMRKMKTRKIRGGSDYLNRYIPSVVSGTEFLPSIDQW